MYSHRPLFLRSIILSAIRPLARPAVLAATPELLSGGERRLPVVHGRCGRGRHAARFGRARRTASSAGVPHCRAGTSWFDEMRPIIHVGRVEPIIGTNCGPICSIFVRFLQRIQTQNSPDRVSGDFYRPSVSTTLCLYANS